MRFGQDTIYSALFLSLHQRRVLCPFASDRTARVLASARYGLEKERERPAGDMWEARVEFFDGKSEREREKVGFMREVC